MHKMLWYKTCPFCNQGRLFIFKNIDLGELYLHCEECERGYRDPNKLSDNDAFLTLLEDFQAEEATMEDLVKFGWDKFNIQSSKE